MFIYFVSRQQIQASKNDAIVGRMSVLYFNKRYKRSGTLWESRYKSCLVQNEEYLMQLYRYIKSNPVRAKMVDAPAEYTGSSYQYSTLAQATKLRIAHTSYQALGNTKQKRL